MKWKLVPVEPTTSMLSGMLGAGCCKSLEKAYTAMLKAAPQPPKLSDERLFHYAAEIRKALEPDPVGATLNIVALLRAIEREILGGSEK